MPTLVVWHNLIISTFIEDKKQQVKHETAFFIMASNTKKRVEQRQCTAVFYSKKFEVLDILIKKSHTCLT